LGVDVDVVVVVVVDLDGDGNVEVDATVDAQIIFVSIATTLGSSRRRDRHDLEVDETKISVKP